MKVVISGGTGFLGRPLAERLAADGHRVTVLTRGRGQLPPERPGIEHVQWDPEGQADDGARVVDGADAIVNLAGESIAARRWTDAQKTRIRESRLKSTRTLVALIQASANRPSVFLSGSAVGYYGSRGDEVLDEKSAPGHDFLAELSVEWEAEAQKASAFTRVVIVRTGIVLDRDGGALRQMLLPFKAFVGGPVGPGTQYMSWIHRRDWVDLAREAIVTNSFSGPLNLTAPEPVTNREFSRALGRALGRPSWLPAPGFALKIVLGEMADALLLSSQRVLPARAGELGFRFNYPTVKDAFQEIFGR